MSSSKDEAARELAELHFGVEPYLERVVRILGDNEEAPTEPIKLLEINAATVATGSVERFTFAASESVPYPTVIAEVTPDEYQQILAQKMKLPAGWSLVNAKTFERSNGT